MSGRIGAPDSPLGIYTERWTFEVRTSDPANTEEGDWWVRGDLAPESNQLATFRFDHGGGVWDIPIYESGTSEPSVYEVWTFRVNGSLGFIPLIEAGDAAFTELRFQHNGTTTAMHNAPGLAAFFDVAITGTNSPVDEGDTLSVDYLVENTGDLQDTQDIRLQDFSDAVVDTDADVQLGGGASSTGTLTWTTQAGDSGEQQVDVLSDDTAASTTVTVGSVLPDSLVDMTLNSTSNGTSKQGVRFNSGVDWYDFGGTLGPNSGGVTTAYIYRFSDGVLMGQKDISALSGGSSFMIQDVGLSANTDYNFVADNGGGSYGYDYEASESFPISSSDGDLTAIDGAAGPQSNRNEVHVFNQIGNVQ